jgi:hypothetical protein
VSKRRYLNAPKRTKRIIPRQPRQSGPHLPLASPTAPTSEEIAEAHRQAMAKALQGKAKGMAQVSANADPDWKDYAWDWVIEYLKSHPTMFHDDLWEEGLVKPRELRASGPLINKMNRKGGIIEDIGKRPRAHGRGAPGTEWRSLIYDPTYVPRYPTWP